MNYKKYLVELLNDTDNMNKRRKILDQIIEEERIEQIETRIATGNINTVNLQVGELILDVSYDNYPTILKIISSLRFPERVYITCTQIMEKR